MIATAHKIDGVWVALPSLIVDVFIGYLTPNEAAIRKDSISFKEGTDTSNLKENQILYGDSDFYYDEDLRMVRYFEVLDFNGEDYLYD